MLLEQLYFFLYMLHHILLHILLQKFIGFCGFEWTAASDGKARHHPPHCTFHTQTTKHCANSTRQYHAIHGLLELIQGEFGSCVSP
jgi:hypothetical protein